MKWPLILRKTHDQERDKLEHHFLDKLAAQGKKHEQELEDVKKDVAKIVAKFTNIEVSAPLDRCTHFRT